VSFCSRSRHTAHLVSLLSFTFLQQAKTSNCVSSPWIISCFPALSLGFHNTSRHNLPTLSSTLCISSLLNSQHLPYSGSQNSNVFLRLRGAWIYSFFKFKKKTGYFNISVTNSSSIIRQSKVTQNFTPPLPLIISPYMFCITA